MRHAPLTDTAIVPPRPSPVLRQTLKGIFTAIIEALHHSRRLQAKRFVRQHRDLIDTAQRSILRELNSPQEAERCWRDLGSGRHPSLSDFCAVANSQFYD